MAAETIAILEQGRTVNRSCLLRRGNVVHLPAAGSLVVSADLHGHTRNFERIVTHADLDQHPDRHVVLQEIIHGGPTDPAGGCLSFRLLVEAVRFQVRYPERVHLILGNHDTAFITGGEVMKDGREMNRAFVQGLEGVYGSDWTAVRDALRAYLASQPLAVRTANRLWMSHSLPADRLLDQFDPAVLDRDLTPADMVKPGSAYILTWGRRMSQTVLDRMAALVDVDLFVLGHQGQPDGWTRSGSRALILACDHNHGRILSLTLDRPYTQDALVEALIPLSAIA